MRRRYDTLSQRLAANLDQRKVAKAQRRKEEKYGSQQNFLLASLRLGDFALNRTQRPRPEVRLATNLRQLWPTSVRVDWSLGQRLPKICRRWYLLGKD